MLSVELLYATPRYQDERVVLTGYAFADVDEHLAGEDEETARRLGWWPNRSTHQTVMSSFRSWARDWAEDGATRAFAVRDRCSGQLLGGCELRRHEQGPHTVSYWTGVSHRQDGVATRALRLLLGYATDQGVTDIACDVARDNVASRKVAEAAGFGNPIPYEDANGHHIVRYWLG
jgi:RimJ/RimL family protein N-acetyltransferase